MNFGTTCERGRSPKSLNDENGLLHFENYKTFDGFLLQLYMPTNIKRVFGKQFKSIFFKQLYAK